MGEPTIAQMEVSMPSRAVVELPSLAVIAADGPADGAGETSGSGPDQTDAPATVLDLFSPSVASVIEREIVPRLGRNEIWSGELAFPRAGDGGDRTAMTLWIPHQRSDGPPPAATVLIGASITAHTSRVAPDPLTGLPTRVVLLDRLDLARRRSRRNNDLLAALFIDLDGLKAINDRHGHEQGDAALRRAAERIRSCMRDGDTVSRFGGDEFVVLCESLDDESQAHGVAERILEQLERDGDTPLSASIGLAFDRGGELNTLDLIGRADAAMYRAKSRGGARVEVFDQEMQGRLAADEVQRARLLNAIAGDGLDLAGQPLFELGTGRVLGVELLIRTEGPDKDVLRRQDLLRLLRDHAEALDTALLGRAIAIARAWRRRFGRDAARIHMKLSPQSVASTDFTRRVATASARHRVDPRHFAFEINVTDLLPGNTREADTARSLARLGSAVVLDGYRGGMAALHLIEQLEPQLIKIPSRGPNQEALDPRVAVALMRSASTLGARSCVSEIEDQPMLERLVRAGVHAGQGTVLSPIAPLGDVQGRLDGGARLGF